MIGLSDETPKHLFWDTCVLTRYLTGQPTGNEATLQNLVDMAKGGKVKIWHSTILYAEIRPKQFQAAGYSQLQDLVDDLTGAFFPVGPTPSILMRASRIRDFGYLHHTPQKLEKTRVLTVPDAIHLCTCLHIKEDRGVSDIVFCTYDDGKGSNYEEKAVSLLRYHDYATEHMHDPDVVAVCKLERRKPWLEEEKLI